MNRVRQWRSNCVIPGAILLGAGSSAYAGIVHTDIPDITLPYSVGGQAFLDLDGNGVQDFAFLAGMGSDGGQALGLNGAEVAQFLYGDASVFFYGDLISKSLFWASTAAIEHNLEAKSAYQWPDRGAYLGVRIPVDGQWHYGWVFLASDLWVPWRGPAAGALTIFDYAYETVADRPIAAGAVPVPGPLAVLAIGAAASVRRKKQAA